MRRKGVRSDQRRGGSLKKTTTTISIVTYNRAGDGGKYRGYERHSSVAVPAKGVNQSRECQGESGAIQEGGDTFFCKAQRKRGAAQSVRSRS